MTALDGRECRRPLGDEFLDLELLREKEIRPDAPAEEGVAGEAAEPKFKYVRCKSCNLKHFITLNLQP